MLKKQGYLGAAALLANLLWGLACADVPAPKKSEGGPAVAATVGDQSITVEQVDAKALTSNIKAYQDLYDARKAALDELIADALLERAASSRGISKDDLVAQEITQKFRPVTDADVQTFYSQNQGRMGGRPLDQVTGQVRQFLTQQNETQVRQAFLNQLKQKAAVRITLDPPRTPVVIAANDPYAGPAVAKVTIVEYSDFQ